MNIFYVTKDPTIAAMSLVDKHVIKMIVESASLLSTAHRMLDGIPYEGKSKTGRRALRYKLEDSREDILYHATHMTHPCSVWVRISVGNYNWLVDHMFALIEEHTYRYEKSKPHKVFGELSYALSPPPLNLRNVDFTTPPSCMDKQYIISENPIENYRNYYRKGKTHLFSYKRREPPEWMKDLIDDYNTETSTYIPRNI